MSRIKINEDLRHMENHLDCMKDLIQKYKDNKLDFGNLLLDLNMYLSFCNTIETALNIRRKALYG